jgi:MFS family permease
MDLQGRLSDVYGRRATLLFVLLFTSFGYLLFALTDRIWIFFLFRIPTGLMKHSLTMARACLTDITSEKDRAVRMGRYSAAATVGFSLGLPIGGHLMESYGFKVAACTTSSVFFLNLLQSWWLIHPTQQSQILRRRQGLLQTLSFTRSRAWPKLSHVMAQRFFTMNSSLIFRRCMHHFVQGRFSMNPLIITYIGSLQHLVSVGTALSMGKISKVYSNNNDSLRFHACLMMSVTIVAALFSVHVWMFVVFFVLFGSMASVTGIAGTQLCLQLTFPEEKGEVLGIGQSVWALTHILGPQIAGISMDYSYNMPMVIAAVFAIAATGIVMMGSSKAERDKKTLKVS